MAGYVPPVKALAATGGAGIATLSLTQSLWGAAVAVVAGGVIMTIARLGPRLAFEPIALEGGRRWRLTYNGRPIGERRRRRH